MKGMQRYRQKQNVDDMSPVSIFKHKTSLHNGHEKYDFRQVSMNTD